MNDEYNVSPYGVSPDRLVIADDVRDALAAGRPVVALESTVIAHGLPHPDNLEVTRSMIEAVRGEGALPAVVALADGKVIVGADDALIDRLATEDDVVKTNLSNMGVVLARRALGATTVAGTLWAAELAGIRVFATGGIGGRHRPTAVSQHDVSADLEALRRFAVLTVSSGIKSVLDVQATREVLETNGIPLLGFQTDTIPLFITPPGGVGVDARVETPREAVEIAAAHWEIGGGGLLLAVPCPADVAIPAEDIEHVMESLESQIPEELQGTRGATPWLLAALDNITQGRSRAANIALLINNAKTAGAAAAELMRLA